MTADGSSIAVGLDTRGEGNLLLADEEEVEEDEEEEKEDIYLEVTSLVLGLLEGKPLSFSEGRRGGLAGF